MSIYLGNKTIVYSDMQGPCPDGFHVPLNTEWQSVYDIWINLGGGSLDGSNFRIVLKLPFAGLRRLRDADIRSQGSVGYYFSSYSNGSASRLDVQTNSIKPQINTERATGASIRCFKNSPVIPTSSWTKLYGTSIEAGGIFWDSTDGLISLSSNGETWITIQDKNLGATTVYNDGDTLSEDNCGKYFQRGNNYGFPRTGSITTSSTQVDASNYGPGNYYSSSIFITNNRNWDSSNNDNLWGGVTQGTSTVTVPAEIKNLYIGDNEVKEVYVGATKIRPKAIPITTRGIYWSSQLGLISLSSDGSTWTTIQDKNLGSTTVWNNGDTLTDNNCGYFFQWGNNYGFPHSGDVTTSRTTVNASNYGPGNYYNSSTYIVGNINNWDTSLNKNLWGNTTNTNAARQGPCIAGYHVPSQTELQGVVSILSALYNYGDTGLTPSDSIPICLKMPHAGYRHHFAGLNSVGSQGAYWSSTPSGNAAAGLTFTSSSYGTGYERQVYGYCIRGFANTSVQPDTSWTKIV